MATASKILSFKAIVTLLLGVVYLGGLGWALYAGKIDVQSFIAGVGPSFGMALGSWFNDTNKADDTP